MAKVLFITTNANGNYLIPLAPGLFTALLKNAGHEIRLYDTSDYDELCGLNLNEAKTSKGDVKKSDIVAFVNSIKPPNKASAKDALNNLIHEFSPDVIMISLTEIMYDQTVMILDYISSRDILTVVGGVFPTLAPEILLRHDKVDMVCIGEGEFALLELCNRLDNGADLRSIKNFYIKDKTTGAIIKNERYPLVDINTLPTPDFSLFKDYRFYKPMAGKIYKMLPFETNRGCPYLCSYCGSPAIAALHSESPGGGRQHFFRKKSVKKMHEEFTSLIKNYSPEYFYFVSDTFLACNENEFLEFVEMYSEINIPFWIQTRVETVTEERMKRLRDVGLHRMSIGVEHGNEAFRKNVLKKGCDNKTIKKAVEIIHSAALPAGLTVNSMIGFPLETRELAMETVSFNHEIAKYIDSMSCNIFVPFHGTELRDLAIDKGFLNPNIISTTSYLDGSILEMPDFSKDDILGISKAFTLYARFDKSRWPEIREAEKNTPEGNELYDNLMKEFHEQYS